MLKTMSVETTLSPAIENGELEEQINSMAIDLYQHSGRMFTPLYPWVFVRVLAKEQKRNGIWLPDIDQNKTVHEGIVLATWKPFTRTKSLEMTSEQATLLAILKKRLPAMAEEFLKVLNDITVTQEIKSELETGDHVLFPHWAGVPIDGFKRKHYRVIRECEWEENKLGGIFAKVEYQEPSVRDKLKTMLCYLNDVNVDKVTIDIEKQFLLVDRDGKSVTISGR